MIENLKGWCEKYFLQIERHSEEIYEIDEFGRFILLKERSGKLFDENFHFYLNDRENHLLQNADKNGVKYIVFEFGGRFYYSELKFVENEDSARYYSVIFNDLLYVGKYTGDFSEIKYSCLGLHTEYELLNSALNVENFGKKAKWLNFESVGMCDKNTLAGSLLFQMDLSKKGFQTIIGETITLRDDEKTFEIKVFVVSESGWCDLLKINKAINVDNEGYIRKDEFFKFSRDLIVVFPYKNSYPLRNKEKFSTIIEDFSKNCFDSFQQFSSVEFSNHTLDEKCLFDFCWYINNADLKRLKPVFIDDIYFLEQEYESIKTTLNTIAKNSQDHSIDFYLKTPVEIIEKILPLFSEEKLYDGLSGLDFVLLAFENSNKIANDCQFRIETGVPKIPKYLDDPEESKELLRLLMVEGFEKKVIGKVNPELYEKYFEQAEKEYDLITSSGLSDYFLILWDIVKWAKENDIFVGPGRGSAGGSLLCHTIDITNLDPIKFELLFERFLNPARLRSPDIIKVTLENGVLKEFDEDELVSTKRGKIRAKFLIEEDEIL